jgi:hypothetical protein
MHCAYVQTRINAKAPSKKRRKEGRKEGRMDGWQGRKEGRKEGTNDRPKEDAIMDGRNKRMTQNCMEELKERCKIVWKVGRHDARIHGSKCSMAGRQKGREEGRMIMK